MSKGFAGSTDQFSWHNTFRNSHFSRDAHIVDSRTYGPLESAFMLLFFGPSNDLTRTPSEGKDSFGELAGVMAMVFRIEGHKYGQTSQINCKEQLFGNNRGSLSFCALISAART